MSQTVDWNSANIDRDVVEAVVEVLVVMDLWPAMAYGTTNFRLAMVLPAGF